jgi:hypothetical protein
MYVFVVLGHLIDWRIARKAMCLLLTGHRTPLYFSTGLA